jgi:hypothetical protein
MWYPLLFAHSLSWYYSWWKLMAIYMLTRDSICICYVTVWQCGKWYVWWLS